MLLFLNFHYVYKNIPTRTLIFTILDPSFKQENLYRGLPRLLNSSTLSLHSSPFFPYVQTHRRQSLCSVHRFRKFSRSVGLDLWKIRPRHLSTPTSFHLHIVYLFLYPRIYFVMITFAWCQTDKRIFVNKLLASDSSVFIEIQWSAQKYTNPDVLVTFLCCRRDSKEISKIDLFRELYCDPAETS